MHTFNRKCGIIKKYIIFFKACCNYWKICIKRAKQHHFRPIFFWYVANSISNYFRILKIPLSNVDFELLLPQWAKIPKKTSKIQKKQYFFPIFLHLRYLTIAHIVALATGIQNQCSNGSYLLWFVSNRVCEDDSFCPNFGAETPVRKGLRF
jgi:hypothetical protein